MAGKLSKRSGEEFPNTRSPCHAFRAAVSPLCLAASLATLAPPIAPAQQVPAQQVPEVTTPQPVSGQILYEQLIQTGEQADENLSVGVRTVRGVRLADHFHLRNTYRAGYVDLAALSALLGGKLTWDGTVLSGWFGHEKHQVHFDSMTRQLTVRQKIKVIEDADIFVEDGSLLATLDVARVIMNIELTFDLQSLEIIIGDRPTPAERMILRRRARHSLGRADGPTEQQGAPAFHGYDSPGRGRLDIVSSGTYQSGTSTAVDQPMQKAVNLHTTAHFDFANSRMKVTATGNDDQSLKDVRVSARRKHYDEQSFYSMMELGDITGYAAVNGGAPLRGTGVKLTNQPIFIPDVVGQQVISGDAPPGWEVELFRDETLIDFVLADRSGRFTFTPADLKSGLNIFTIRMFGPEGQVETKTRRILANHGVPRQGRTRYQFSALQAHHTLVGVHERATCQIPSSCNRTAGAHAFVGNVTYAMTNQTALNASLSRMPEGTTHANFASLGFLGSLAGRQWKIDATTASGAAEGNAVRAYYRLQFGRLSGSITHSEFNGFTAESAIRHNSLLRRKTRLVLNIPPVSIGGARTPVQMTNTAILSTHLSRDDQHSTAITLGQSFSRQRLRISSSLSASTSDAVPRKHAASGTLTATQYLERAEIYSRVLFGLKPENRIERVTVGHRFRHRQDRMTTMELKHEPRRHATTRLKAGLTTEQSRYRLGLSSEMDTHGDYKLSFTLESSLVRPVDRPRSMTLLNRREARGAVIIVNAFLDENGNGSRDHDEPPLHDSVVNITPPARRITRSSDGTQIFEGLPIDRTITTTIEPRSDKHLLLTTKATSHRMVLRDGTTKILDVAAQPAGEISGVVLQRSTSGDSRQVDHPLSQIPIEILDVSGRVINTVQTIYDGSFVASNIPFGPVTLRPSPDHFVRRGMSILSKPDEHIITLSQDLVWVDDVVILLTAD